MNFIVLETYKVELLCITRLYILHAMINLYIYEIRKKNYKKKYII